MLKFVDFHENRMSPPSRVEWIEIPSNAAPDFTPWSPPSRVEWIEIENMLVVHNTCTVSAFAGGVD